MYYVEGAKRRIEEWMNGVSPLFREIPKNVEWCLLTEEKGKRKKKIKSSNVEVTFQNPFKTLNFIQSWNLN